MEKFKVLTIERYKNQNNGRDPREDGMLVKPLKVPNLGVVDCVLIRKCPEGEWGMELDISTTAVLREEVDSGEVSRHNL